ncbi:MAG: hypothetical protein ABSF53_16085 [Terracidiphilus sp.]|jgi:hypothetical protein
MTIARELTGGLHVSVRELLRGKDRIIKQVKDVRVDFDEIPKRVSQVRQSAARNIQPLLKRIADKLPRPAGRESLLAMGIPPLLADDAMQAYYGS